MEFLNKIANAVVTNPLIKEYEILNDVSQAGPWVIQNAIKRSTKEKVSVFILSKKIFDKMKRQHKDQVLEKYRIGVKLLTKVRHPKFLTIQHPLEESRECLAFATEPCLSSLDNLIKVGALTDVEIKYGILQLLDGISFLHNELKKCHRNICPNSVAVNSQGLWKIFGLEFSCVSEESSEPPPQQFIFYDDDPIFSQPNLKYLAPELLSSKFSETSADMYSFGCLIYALYNHGRTIRHGETVSAALKQSNEISHSSEDILGKVPHDGNSDVKQLLSTEPKERQKIDVFYQAKFLSDIGALSLKFLDNFMLKNRNQKIEFFKELPEILPRLPSSVKKERVLCQLFECCKEEDLIAFILPSIFYIGSDLVTTDFQAFISPGLQPILKITEPPHIPMIIIQNLNLIISKTKLEEAKIFIIPLLFKCLENPITELQESVLKLLPDIVDLMDYSTLRHQLLPKIKCCCLETRLLKIRVGSLICIAKVLDSNFVDKSLVDDILLPLLEQVPSKEPAVLMSILGIYQKLLKHRLNLLDKDTLANRCVPIMFPMLIAPSLNIQQFNTCLTIIKEMISKVELEQLAKLKQLEQNQIEQDKSLSFSKDVVENKQVGELVTKMDQMFGNSPAQTAKYTSNINHSSGQLNQTESLSLPNPCQEMSQKSCKNELKSNCNPGESSTFDSKMFEMVSLTSVSKPSTQQCTINNNYSQFDIIMDHSKPNSAINRNVNCTNEFPLQAKSVKNPVDFAGTSSLSNNFAQFNSGNKQSIEPSFIPICKTAEPSQSQVHTTNSLDRLFGPKCLQPSLNQLANSTNRETPSNTDTSLNNRANVDLSDIFG